MVRTTIALFVPLALGAGVILLQIYLSKKENKWVGLILPIITLCISLIAVFSIAAFTTMTTTPQVIDENEMVIQEAAPENTAQPIQSASSLIFMIGSVFLLYNIPTAVLLAIYFGCREKQRQRKALEKMQAQDLQ